MTASASPDYRAIAAAEKAGQEWIDALGAWTIVAVREVRSNLHMLVHCHAVRSAAEGGARLHAVLDAERAAVRDSSRALNDQPLEKTPVGKLRLIARAQCPLHPHCGLLRARNLGKD